MAQLAKSVLRIDDEAELLKPHRMFLRDNRFEVVAGIEADDVDDVMGFLKLSVSLLPVSFVTSRR